MKSVLALIFILAFASSSAQTLTFNDETTDVQFNTTHGLAKLHGSFKGVSGSGYFNPQRIQSSFLRLTMQTNTVTTTDNLMGPSLIKDECFDIANHPTLNIVSTSISSRGKNKYYFRGTITIKGISQQVTFPFTAKPNVGGYDFNFNFDVSRKNFDLDCNFMSRNIDFEIKAYGKKV